MINKLLKKGGYTLNVIDLRDHFSIKNNPFRFYKYEKKEWDKLTQSTIFYTNRLRFTEYLSKFKQNGFKIIDYKTIKNSKNISSSSISSDFIKFNPTELKTESIILLCKKIGGI
jgi:hypothetical protein